MYCRCYSAEGRVLFKRVCRSLAELDNALEECKRMGGRLSRSNSRRPGERDPATAESRAETRVVSIKVSDIFYRRIEDEARRLKISKSALIRLAIKHYLQPKKNVIVAKGLKIYV